MTKNSTASPVPNASRVERILSVMMLAIVALSIACFIAVIVGTSAGMDQGDFGQGIWPIVTILPLFGLPIAFLLIIVVILLNARRRGKNNRQK